MVSKPQMIGATITTFKNNIMYNSPTHKCSFPRFSTKKTNLRWTNTVGETKTITNAKKKNNSNNALVKLPGTITQLLKQSCAQK